MDIFETLTDNGRLLDFFFFDTSLPVAQASRERLCQDVVLL